MKLKEAAKGVEDSIEETLTYMDFPDTHWLKIRTNNVTERLNREIRRRTRMVGTFPDGNSTLMLVCARLRPAASTAWSTKRHMNMKNLDVPDKTTSDFVAELTADYHTANPNLRKTIGSTSPHPRTRRHTAFPRLPQYRFHSDENSEKKQPYARNGL